LGRGSHGFPLQGGGGEEGEEEREGEGREEWVVLCGISVFFGQVDPLVGVCFPPPGVTETRSHNT